MHKKLEADLISLAHSILQMKNRDDVFALEEKAKVIVSKLSMLAFVETYVNTTPNLKETKEELIFEIEKAFENKNLTDVSEEIVTDDIEINKEAESIEIIVEEVIKEVLVTDDIIITEEQEEQEEQEQEEEEEEEETPELEQPFAELEETLFSVKTSNEDDKSDIEIKTSSLEEELKDTFPVDMMANLFESVQPKSLNDALTKNIQIGLNDRIAFVKNLFDGSQEDFNRVVSQLNSFKTEKEARKFINKMVKPDYKWDDQEEYEARFMEIVQRKFD